jgi:hypothetical protein
MDGRLETAHVGPRHRRRRHAGSFAVHLEKDFVVTDAARSVGRKSGVGIMFDVSTHV